MGSYILLLIMFSPLLATIYFFIRAGKVYGKISKDIEETLKEETK